MLASIFTLIELAGLLAVIVAAAGAGTPIGDTLLTLPATGAWAGVAFASLLAFFAFIGFQGLINVVEEAHAPERNIPLAMALVLGIATLLYVLIAAISVTAVPVDRLATSAAPLSLIFRELAGGSPATIAAIAIVATLNTIIAELTMATRVVYGMAKLGDLAGRFRGGQRRHGDAVAATALIAAAALALLAPLERLAEATSLATLIVFAMVNLALLKLRHDGVPAPPASIRVPIAVPILGLVSCVAMIAFAII